MNVVLARHRRCPRHSMPRRYPHQHSHDPPDPKSQSTPARDRRKIQPSGFTNEPFERTRRARGVTIVGRTSAGGKTGYIDSTPDESTGGLAGYREYPVPIWEVSAMAEALNLSPERLQEHRAGRAGPPGGGPAIVFAPDSCELPAVELCLNFGLLAGRDVTAAEIEQLASDLLARVAHVSIISERRYERGALSAEQRDLAELRGRLMEISERWLEACLAARTLELHAA